MAAIEAFWLSGWGASVAADSALANDAVVRLVAFTRIATDAAPATDLASGTGKMLSRSATEAAPASDAPTRVLVLARSASDAAAGSDVTVGISGRPLEVTVSVSVRTTVVNLASVTTTVTLGASPDLVGFSVALAEATTTQTNRVLVQAALTLGVEETTLSLGQKQDVLVSAGAVGVLLADPIQDILGRNVTEEVVVTMPETTSSNTVIDVRR